MAFTTLTITTSTGFQNISLTSRIKPFTWWESSSWFSLCQLLAVTYLLYLYKFAYSEYFISMLWWLVFGDMFISLSTMFSRLIYIEAYARISLLFISFLFIHFFLFTPPPVYHGKRDQHMPPQNLKDCQKRHLRRRGRKDPLLPVCLRARHTFTKMYPSLLPQKHH